MSMTEYYNAIMQTHIAYIEGLITSEEAETHFTILASLR